MKFAILLPLYALLGGSLAEENDGLLQANGQRPKGSDKKSEEVVDDDVTLSLSQSEEDNNVCPQQTWPVCIKVKTGNDMYANGGLKLLIDSGEGLKTVASSTMFAKGSVVLDKCYARMLDMEIQATTNNGWIGEISYAIGDGVKAVTEYKPMTCRSCQNGESTKWIIVDAKGGPIDAHTMKGRTMCRDAKKAPCRINPIPSQQQTQVSWPVCIKVKTGNDKYANGGLKVLIDSGNGLKSVATNEMFDKGSVVLDKCFNKFLNMELQATTNNGWIGEISYAIGNGVKPITAYQPMTCRSCQNGESTKWIIVDAKGGPIDATTKKGRTMCKDAKKAPCQINPIGSGC